MSRIVREPTLTLDYAQLERNIGFRAPWLVRLRLFWLGLTMRAVSFEIAVEHFSAHGWFVDGVPYVTRVTRSWWRA